MVAAALVPYPAGLGVAALRYRLWDVDLVLRRSLVYAVLTACIVGAYVLAIVTLGGLLGRTTGAPLVATAVVALGAAPLYRRLQSAADRLLYGDRSDPAAAVSRLARRVQAAAAGRDPDALLSEVARDIARGAAGALRAHHHRRRTRQPLRRAGRGRLASAPGPRRGRRG